MKPCFDPLIEKECIFELETKVIISNLDSKWEIIYYYSLKDITSFQVTAHRHGIAYFLNVVYVSYFNFFCVTFECAIILRSPHFVVWESISGSRTFFCDKGFSLIRFPPLNIPRWLNGTKENCVMWEKNLTTPKLGFFVIEQLCMGEGKGVCVCVRERECVLNVLQRPVTAKMIFEVHFK